MSIFKVDESKCKKCGICAQSCPIRIIDNGIDKIIPSVKPENESRCVYCGQCESVCPDSALVHELSNLALEPMEKGSATINPSELGIYFRNRRSIRKYLPKKVEKAVIEKVMDVVRYAPTGTNRQLNQWVIVSDNGLIEKLAGATINWMKVVSRANPEMAGKYNLQSVINAYDNGIDGICRNAPHLFICYSYSNHPVGPKDAVIATSHLELLLPSYGIGSCWAGFLMMALQNSPEMKNLIGLDDSSTVHAALMAGYPKFRYYTIPVRNKADIKWL